MRAAIYLRISIDRTGDMLAINRQRRDCLALCEAKGWTPVEYVDNSVSASHGTRPAYQQLLADIAAGTVDAVVVWDLDRLHRRPIELEQFIALADRHQLALATVTGEVDLGTDNGRLFARIKGAVARAEVERKSARQLAASRQRAAAGKPWSSVRPFGFEADLVTHHPDEAPVVRALYRQVNAGVGLMALTRWLNDSGISTSKGGAWQHQTLKQTLRRPRYAGLLEHRGDVVGAGTWEPIVTEDEWRSAVARLTSRVQLGRRPKGLLSALAVCGVCGGRVSRANANGKVAYVCADHKHVTRRADFTDERVVAIVLARLQRRDARQLLVVEEDDSAALRAEADLLRDRLEQIATTYADGELTLPEWKTARDRVKTKLAEVEGRMSLTPDAPLLRPLIESTDIRATWEALDLERQRGVIDALVTVKINKTPLGPRFRPQDVQVQLRRQNAERAAAS